MSAVTDQDMAFGWRARGLADSMADPFRPGEPHLNDRTRHIVGEIVRGAVSGIEPAIRRHAGGLLEARGFAREAEALRSRSPDVERRLEHMGVLRDPDLAAELIARVRLDLIGEALPIAAVGPDEASLLVRLTEAKRQAVASAAKALLVADARRHDSLESGTAVRGDLPAELHQRLVWWSAAVIGVDTDTETDRALTEAALRISADHDEGDRAEIAALRLAEAIDARGAELQDLLVAALGDSRIRLFTALLAHASGVDFNQARGLVLEPQGERLWMTLRALKMDRATIARVAAPLAEADSARDLDALAERLDEIGDLPAAEACEALRPLRWRREYREAIRAVRGAG